MDLNKGRKSAVATGHRRQNLDHAYLATQSLWVIEIGKDIHYGVIPATPHPRGRRRWTVGALETSARENVGPGYLRVGTQ